MLHPSLLLPPLLLFFLLMFIDKIMFDEMRKEEMILKEKMRDEEMRKEKIRKEKMRDIRVKMARHVISGNSGGNIPYITTYCPNIFCNMYGYCRPEHHPEHQLVPIKPRIRKALNPQNYHERRDKNYSQKNR